MHNGWVHIVGGTNWPEGDEDAFAEAVTRITVQIAFRELIQQIAINLAINVGVDTVIQGLQFAPGDRHSWDVGKTVDAGISGRRPGSPAAGSAWAAAR